MSNHELRYSYPEYIKKRNETLAGEVIRGLKSRNMNGYYAENKAKALKTALEIIPPKSTIAMGGAMSVRDIGLIDAIEEGDFNYIDRDEAKDKRQASLKAYDADFFLSSANSITKDGVIINIDGNANRVSAISYGPRKVLFVIGMNKVCPDVDSAMKRARNVAAPMNVLRFDINPPCREKGSCLNCKSPDTICCQFLITRYSRDADRIHVIMVNEDLGF